MEKTLEVHEIQAIGTAMAEMIQAQAALGRAFLVVDEAKSSLNKAEARYRGAVDAIGFSKGLAPGARVSANGSHLIGEERNG